VAIGIGSSEPYKQWGAARFAALADALASRGIEQMILLGGNSEIALAAEIKSLTRATGITAAIGWNLSEIAALFSLSKFYVGNDTGVMNMAAAVGIRTYCLFGAVPPLHHSTRIVPITPPGGVSKADGMARLLVDQVLAAIETDQTSART
jgi:heptosyltransferase-2